MEDTDEIAEFLHEYDEEITFGIIDLVNAIEDAGSPALLDAVADFRAAQARDAVYGYRLGTDEAEQDFLQRVRAVAEGRA